MNVTETTAATTAAAKEVIDDDVPGRPIIEGREDRDAKGGKALVVEVEAVQGKMERVVQRRTATRRHAATATENAKTATRAGEATDANAIHGAEATEKETGTGIVTAIETAIVKVTAIEADGAAVEATTKIARTANGEIVEYKTTNVNVLTSGANASAAARHLQRSANPHPT